MKLVLENNFITDNSSECENGCYFVKTNSNKKFISLVKKSNIITPKEAIKLVNPKVKIIGITGTNGKTTTATLIAHILNYLGHKCCLCGTRGVFIGEKQIAPKGLTTPQFLDILNFINIADKENCEYFIMEVSSHAIAQNRIESLDFVLKIFTNLTQDHLDYHKTFEEYCGVKSNFFADESLKLINKDDKFIKFFNTNTHFYSCLHEAEFSVDKTDFSNGIEAVLKANDKNYSICSKLQGQFNLYNILCAFGAVNLLGFHDDLQNAINDFYGVDGRVEVVSIDPLVIVDFAHTPDGIEKVLKSLENKELIVVFGAGGNRDKTKRPIMGKIASKYAKILIITSDNPRDEEPLDIIEDIKAGIPSDKEFFCEVNREKAIQMALNLVKDNQVIAILGKGDETTQEIKGVKYPFSDKEIVKKLLKEK